MHRLLKLTHISTEAKKKKDKEEKTGKLSKKEAKKCLKDEKALIKCYDNEVYNVKLSVQLLSTTSFKNWQRAWGQNLYTVC